MLGWGEMERYGVKCVTNKRKEKAGKRESYLSQKWKEKQVDLVVVPNPLSINGTNFT